MSIRQRIAIGALAFSAAGIVGLVGYEGYTDRAVIPVPGDVPTIGPGLTRREDGSPVQMGDKITVPKALSLSLREVRQFEGAIKRCVKVPLHQYEYDAYTQLAYNIGGTLFCSSTLVKVLNAGNYDGACRHIEDFVCGPATEKTQALPGEKCYSERKPRKIINGLQNRRARERELCEGKQTEVS